MLDAEELVRLFWIDHISLRWGVTRPYFKFYSSGLNLNKEAFG